MGTVVISYSSEEKDTVADMERSSPAQHNEENVSESWDQNADPWNPELLFWAFEPSCPPVEDLRSWPGTREILFLAQLALISLTSLALGSSFIER